MKRLQFFSLFISLILVAGLFSCERLSEIYRMGDATGTRVVQDSDQNGDEKPGDPCGEPIVIRLISKDNLEYSPAQITVTNDDEFLNVKFEVTENGWNFDMLYLEVGPLDLVPIEQDDNYPMFWDFDYKFEDLDHPVAAYTFQIALASLDECVTILAQARLTDGNGKIVILWSEGENPDWTQGPFYTYHCIENCKEPCNECKMGIYRTQTQGGWGAKAAGNNPGAYRDANFDGAFPNGLTVGDPDNYFILLTSSAAVEKLLPTGGTPAALTMSYEDPESIKNVLVGQVVALSLSVGFDQYDKDFGMADGHLGNLLIAPGYGFDGMSVTAVLEEANMFLGGGSSSHTASKINEMLTRINEYFVDGKKSESRELFDCK